MAKNDLRSQLRATKINQLKKSVDADNNLIGASNNEYLSLEDGKAIKIRIFPAHPGRERFYVSKKCYWLSRLNNDGDAKRMTVLDSIVHGATKLDIVAEYAKMVKRLYAKNAKIMEAVSGEKNSLNPSYSWVAYAAKVSGEDALNPMMWEFKKMVRDGLNKLAFSEEEDEPIEVDPFTDVDEGIPVMVKYMKAPNRKKGENYYEVSFPKNTKARPLTDEEIEAFMALKPLEEAIGSYNIKEFDRALEGLQYFDEEHSVGLFDNDDWLEIIETVKAQYDEVEDDDDDAPKKPVKKVVKKVVEDDDDEDEEPAPKKKKKPVVEEDDDDDEEPVPVKKKKPAVVEDDEDEEPAPKKKKKPIVDDDEDDVPAVPVKKKKPVVVDDDDDDEPAPKKKAKPVVEDDDDEDEEPVAKKPKMSVADIKAKLGKK